MFTFPIVNFPFIISNSPASTVYLVYISQFIGYSRACVQSSVKISAANTKATQATQSCSYVEVRFVFALFVCMGAHILFMLFMFVYNGIKYVNHIHFYKMIGEAKVKVFSVNISICSSLCTNLLLRAKENIEKLSKDKLSALVRCIILQRG